MPKPSMRAVTAPRRSSMPTVLTRFRSTTLRACTSRPHTPERPCSPSAPTRPERRARTASALDHVGGRQQEYWVVELSVLAETCFGELDRVLVPCGERLVDFLLKASRRAFAA